MFVHELFECFWFFLDEAEKMEHQGFFLLRHNHDAEISGPELENWAYAQRGGSAIVFEELFLWQRQQQHRQEKSFKYSQNHVFEVLQTCNRIAAENFKGKGVRR